MNFVLHIGQYLWAVYVAIFPHITSISFLNVCAKEGYLSKYEFSET